MVKLKHTVQYIMIIAKIDLILETPFQTILQNDNSETV